MLRNTEFVGKQLILIDLNTLLLYKYLLSTELNFN